MKKIVTVATAAMMIMFCFLISGCYKINLTPVKEKVEGEVWTYYIMKDDTAALIGLNEKAVPEDGVLYIPNEVDGIKVSMLGIYKNLFFGEPFSVPYMQRIIIAEGVPVSSEFWKANLARITEFESKSAENIEFYVKTLSQWGGGEIEQPTKKIIIPEGCSEKYTKKMENKKQELSSRFVIVEKSELIDDAWHVNEDGLLLGYYGTDPDNYVLSIGLKRINSFSWWYNDNPKTIILNEDLEEIRSSGLWFNYKIDEIYIPKSVKIIEQRSVSMVTVYLYHSTEFHEQAFISGVEIIYLD